MSTGDRREKKSRKESRVLAIRYGGRMSSKEIMRGDVRKCNDSMSRQRSSEDVKKKPWRGRYERS